MFMRKKNLYRFLLILWISGLFAQSLSAQYNSRSRRYQTWKMFRHQVGINFGLTGFLGDLGGANAIGSDGIKDLNFSQTRITASIEYRYFLKRILAVRGAFLFGFLSGDDATTEEPFRRNRNLHFRATIFELSGMLEFFLMREEVMRSRLYSGGFSMDIYVFLGAGLMYFNPQAQYEGQWINLQPLGTEGQGIELQPDPYNRFTAVIPVGIGLAKNFKQYWSVGIEASYRKTFTDYIDDVSTNYFNNDKIREAYGDVAAYLADPSLGYIIDSEGNKIPINATGEGMQRGDPNDLDAYLTLVVTARFYLAGLSNGRRRTKRTRF